MVVDMMDTHPRIYTVIIEGLYENRDESVAMDAVRDGGALRDSQQAEGDGLLSQSSHYG